MKPQEYIADAKNLSDAELQKKYKLTYGSWNLIFVRRDKGEAIIAQEFADFRSFLKIMGVRKHKVYTLERLDNDDLEYAEGKVEWRDKTAQNNNKGNNVYLTHDDGRVFTVAQWSKQLNVKPNTLYKRRDYGWSDMEIISGKRIKPESKSIIDNPFPYGKSIPWEQKFMQASLDYFNLSKLDYLLLRSRHELVRRQMCLDVINITLNNKNDSFPKFSMLEGFYLDAREETQSNKHSQLKREISRCKSLTSPMLKQRKQRMEMLVESYEKIIPQASSQVEYEAKLKVYIEKRRGHLSEAIIRKYFEKLYPRPKYTLNLPLKVK